MNIGMNILSYKRTLFLLVLLSLVLFTCATCLPVQLPSEDRTPAPGMSADPDSDDDGDNLALSFETELGTDPKVPNPNVVYALQRGLSAYVDKIKLYDDDGEQSEDEVFNIDLVKSIVTESTPLKTKQRNISYILSGNGPEIRRLHNQLSEVSPAALEKIFALGLGDDVMEYVSYVVSLSDKDSSYIKTVLENGWCFQDRILEDYEKGYLIDPDGQYREIVFNNYLSEIESVNPVLADELKKLPDLAHVDRNNVEMLEDIVDLVKADSVFGTSFESILNEGIIEKRKYCSPLEALVWILYDKDSELLSLAMMSYLYSPLAHEFRFFQDANLMRLVAYSYQNSTMSTDHHFGKWDNYDDVVDRLNSPLIIKEAYKALNIIYKPKAGNARTPGLVLKGREGDCDDQAWLWTSCLLKNGYKFDDFENNETNAVCGMTVEWKSWKKSKEISAISKGHGFTLLKMDGLFYIYEYGTMKGPFNDLYEICDRVAASVGTEWIIYALYDGNWNETESGLNPG